MTSSTEPSLATVTYTDRRQIDDAPFPTAVGRSVGTSTLKVNGWLALVKLDDENFLKMYAQAPRGFEQQYLEKVIAPLLRSVVYKPANQ